MAKGQVVGYIRVSSAGQNLDRQQEVMDEIGPDQLFQDKASGGSTDRPGLKACLKYLRPDDVLVVASIDRAARSLQDLQAIVQALTGRGVKVRFIKEGLTFSPAQGGSATERLLFQILGAFAEFERSLIRERQAEGIRAARDKGVRFGRRPKLDDAKRELALSRLAAGESPASIAKDLGVSRQTVWRLTR